MKHFQQIRFADDTDLITNSSEKIKNLINHTSYFCKAYGLKKNIEKKKIKKYYKRKKLLDSVQILKFFVINKKTTRTIFI